jgi:hypothetical protein
VELYRRKKTRSHTATVWADLTIGHLISPVLLISSVLLAGGSSGCAEAPSNVSAPPDAPTEAATAAAAQQALVVAEMDRGHALLGLSLMGASDEDYAEAVAFWLLQHEQYSHTSDQEVIASHLPCVMNQYPRVAIGAALDMALQRAIRTQARGKCSKASARTPLPNVVAEPSWSTRSTGAGSAAAAEIAAGAERPANRRQMTVEVQEKVVIGGTPNRLPSWDSMQTPQSGRSSDPAKEVSD